MAENESQDTPRFQVLDEELSGAFKRLGISSGSQNYYDATLKFWESVKPVLPGLTLEESLSLLLLDIPTNEAQQIKLAWRERYTV